MSRHPFRWESLAFGAFFLAVVGNWAVWKEDLLTAHELTLSASGVLIFLGVIGIAATVWQAKPARPVAATASDPAADEPHDTDEASIPNQEGHDHEEAEPKP